MNKHLITLRVFLVLSLLLSSSCYAQQENIVLLNKTKTWKEMAISYWSPSNTIPIGYHELMASGQVDKDNFMIVIPAVEPLFLNFSWDFKFQIVCLYPGDTLEFRKTGNEFPFQFDGTRPRSELMFYTLLEAEKLGVLAGNYNLEVTSRLNYQYVADRALEMHNERLKLLNDQVANGDFTKQGHNSIVQSLYYRYLSDLLFPYQPVKPIEVIAKLTTVVPDYYKAQLRNLRTEFDKDSLMYLLDYKRFVIRYARFLMIEGQGAEEAEISSLLKFYNETFNGRKKDLLLFSEIVFNYQMTGDMSPMIEVLDSIENQAMRETLLSMQRKSKSQFSKLALEAELESPDGIRYTLKEMLSGFAGKLVYIDFWATWCRPCLIEMPESEKLAQEFRDRNIEFVYLSIDSEKPKWLKKMETLPQGRNIHHYLLKDGIDFIQQMGIPSVPRYILVSRDGTMITFDAPRPRSVELRNLINESLETSTK